MPLEGLDTAVREGNIFTSFILPEALLTLELQQEYRGCLLAVGIVRAKSEKHSWQGYG
jgi:hypothetical protein